MDEKLTPERDSKGRILKGAQIAKKDFTKEMAKHVTSQELYWCSQMISQVPVSELRKMIANGDIENQSLLTYTTIKNAIKGDFKPMRFMIEMLCGKPKQQIEQKITEETIVINIDKDDADL